MADWRHESAGTRQERGDGGAADRAGVGAVKVTGISADIGSSAAMPMISLITRARHILLARDRLRHAVSRVLGVVQGRAAHVWGILISHPSHPDSQDG